MAFELAQHIGPGPYIRKFQIDDTLVAGQMVVAIDGAGSNNGAIGDPGGVNTLKDILGVTTEAGTVSTTKGESAVEVEVTVNYTGPVYRGPCSGATTVGTVLVEYINDTQDTAALTVTHNQSGWQSTRLDDYAAIFCRTGANAGQIRKISANTATTYVVVLPWDSTLEVDDTFVILSAGLPGCIGRIQLTTDFQGVDCTADTDVSSLADEIIVWGYEGLDISGSEKILFSWRGAVDQLAVT